MSLKSEEYYPQYSAYLQARNYPQSKLKLLLISKSFFDEFVVRYEKDVFFKLKYENTFKSLIRDQKIENLLNEHDTKTQQINS